jgi:hypothetical protein
MSTERDADRPQPDAGEETGSAAQVARALAAAEADGDDVEGHSFEDADAAERQSQVVTICCS